MNSREDVSRRPGQLPADGHSLSVKGGDDARYRLLVRMAERRKASKPRFDIKAWLELVILSGLPVMRETHDVIDICLLG